MERDETSTEGTMTTDDKLTLYQGAANGDPAAVDELDTENPGALSALEQDIASFGEPEDVIDRRNREDRDGARMADGDCDGQS
jgi:hypothetical protein